MRRALAVVATILAIGVAGSGATPAASPLGRYLVPTRALWAEFEQPGSPRGWYTGQLLGLIGLSAVKAEVGASSTTCALSASTRSCWRWRTAGGNTPPPWSDCDLSPELGPSWPQPTTQELNGLRTVLDLARRHGMQVMLLLNNTHMDAQPPVDSQRWLGAVKDSPALDVVAFGGDRQTIDAEPPYDGVPDSCGGQSEAPLWLGPDSIQGRYVQWAIGYGISLGLPPQKLTAEAIVGYYPHEIEQGAGPDAEDRHLWRPLEVMKTIFDRLAVDPSRRTYALSYYEHPKCAFVDRSFTTCVDEDEFAWTEETLRVSRARIAPESRLTIAEWGVQPSEPAISRAVEHFGATLQQFGLEGGAYWKWADSAAADGPYATNPEALVKVRGPRLSLPRGGERARRSVRLPRSGCSERLVRGRYVGMDADRKRGATTAGRTCAMARADLPPTAGRRRGLAAKCPDPRERVHEIHHDDETSRTRRRCHHQLPQVLAEALALPASDELPLLRLE